MDLVESGAIFNFKPFNPQSSRDCGKNESLNLSSKLASRTNSRFEELFLSSPRAQELVATIDQSSYFTSSKSRIISPHKQQCFLHNSFSQTPLSSSCSGKNTSSLMDSGLINMLDFFKNGKQPRCQESALFSPVKPSNMEDDSIRTQVRDVINKLGTPLNRKGRTNDDDGLSLNPDSGYDEQQMQSCGLTTSSRSRSPTLNHPQSELPKMAIELRQEYKFDPKVSKPKPDVDGEVQEEDVDVGEFDQQNDPGTENVESKLKQTTESTVEDMEYNVVPELDVPDVPDTNLVDDKIKEPLHAESLSKVRSDKKHHLFGWYIKAIKTKNGPAIIVEGQRREDPVGELWHSTGIVTRVSPSVVETKSKSQYVLEGKMLGNETIEQGFSVQFAKAFTNGFPSNWEQLVKEHFESIVDTSSKKDKQQQEAKKSSISKKQPSLNKRTPRNDGRKPVEVELKRTSSGRLIKPPLAWWRGQRIVTDSQHNLTAIEPGGEEHTGLSVGLYDFDLKLPKTKTSLWNSAVMTPKIAKFDLTTEAKHPRKNDTTTNAAKSAKDDTWKKTLKPETSFLGESGSESTGSTSHNSRKNTEDTSEKPNTSYTDSDTSSFPKVMRPKRVLSDSSWRPSDSDSTTVRSSNTAIQKSKKSQERSKSKLTLSRKQHLEVSPEESTNNEEESQDDRDAKDHVKRNISFSDDDDDDDDDWKSPRQKIPQEKSTIDKPLREVKVVLAKNPQQRRDKNQTKDKSKDNDSATVLNNVLNDNHESDGVNSCEYFTRNKALSKNSSKAKFRKPEHYVQKQKKGHFEAQSRPESSSEEGLPRRSLRNRKEKNHDVSKNKDLRDNNKEHRRYGSRTRHGSLKHPSIVEEDEAGTSSSDEEEAQAVVEMMRSVRQRKAAAEREDSEATSDSDSSKKKMRKQTARKTKNQRSKARNTQEIKQQRNMGMEDGEEDGTDGRNWKEDEIFRLSKALHSIPLSTFGYWHSISEAVQTRTAQECRLKYDEQLNMNLKIRNPVTKPKEKQPKVNQKVVAITGGVGTMKRKRELRQLIQQNNDGYEDDIFESTPFKNTQKKFKFFTEEDAEEESDDENDDEDQHNHVDFKTPSSRTPSSRYRPLGPGGSSSNTPGSDLISPGLLQQINREDMDQYIYRLKQAKKGMGQYRKQDKVKVVKTSTPKKKATALMPKTDASIFDVQEVLEQDSDEENDYYWSDE